MVEKAKDSINRSDYVEEDEDYHRWWGSDHWLDRTKRAEGNTVKNSLMKKKRCQTHWTP